MAQYRVYRGRQAWRVDDYAPPGEGWIGEVLDYGDGLTFGVTFGEMDSNGDPLLVIDPTDEEWLAAAPLTAPLQLRPGLRWVTTPDGTTAIHPRPYLPPSVDSAGWSPIPKEPGR